MIRKDKPDYYFSNYDGADIVYRVILYFQLFDDTGKPTGQAYNQFKFKTEAAAKTFAQGLHSPKPNAYIIIKETEVHTRTEEVIFKYNIN